MTRKRLRSSTFSSSSFIACYGSATLASQSVETTSGIDSTMLTTELALSSPDAALRKGFYSSVLNLNNLNEKSMLCFLSNEGNPNEMNRTTGYYSSISSNYVEIDSNKIQNTNNNLTTFRMAMSINPNDLILNTNNLSCSEETCVQCVNAKKFNSNDMNKTCNQFKMIREQTANSKVFPRTNPNYRNYYNLKASMTNKSINQISHDNSSFYRNENDFDLCSKL